jgi:Phage tail lysozyme
MPIPQNAQNIYLFLTSHGYTPVAASGILGNIEQESGGNPTAGTNPPGAGLIQELGDPGGSLASEEQVILDYNNRQGAGLVSSLNAQTDPSSAALFYSQYFERPLASAANNANREQSAVQVFQAAQSGNWPAGSGASSSGGSGSGSGTPATTTSFIGSLNPANWIPDALGIIGSKFGGTIKDWLERLGLIILGFALVLLGIHLLTGGNLNTPSAPSVASNGGGSSSKTNKPLRKQETTATKSVGTEEAVEAAAVA